MKILSIDQSYTCSGIVVLDDGDVTHCEVHKTGKVDRKDLLAMIKRAHGISSHLVKVAKEHNPDLIAIEGLAYGMTGSATRDLAGLQFAIIIDLLLKNKYSIEIIVPKAAKSLAVGPRPPIKGFKYPKITKQDMIDNLPDETRKKFDLLGVKKTTGLGDLADAYWIGKTAEKKEEEK